MSDYPIAPPVSPMLARRAERIPRGAPGVWRYEPKFDGVRAVVFRAGEQVLIQSRQANPLQDALPDVVEAVRQCLPARCVVDGELVVTDADGTSFRAVMSRLSAGPGRVARLARAHPALLVVFDALAIGDQVLVGRPFAERRAALEDALPGGAVALAASLGVAPATGQAPARIQLMPQTEDPELAERWIWGLAAAGVEGVVAKASRLPYRAGRREMVKVKRPAPGGR